jgi:hypothetical protein
LPLWFYFAAVCNHNYADPFEDNVSSLPVYRQSFSVFQGMEVFRLQTLS